MPEAKIDVAKFAVEHNLTADQVQELIDRVGHDEAALQAAVADAEREADPVNQPGGGAYR